jgi:hypothetical protein
MVSGASCTHSQPKLARQVQRHEVEANGQRCKLHPLSTETSVLADGGYQSETDVNARIAM